jgi:Cu/Zn superoxide dismutase
MKRITGLALVLFSAACASGSGGGDTEGIVDFKATLAPTAGNQVKGTANAVASLGRTAVTVEIEGATPGAQHPWHVHQGRCGSNGPVVGKASDYPVIDVDADGKVRVSAVIATQLVDDQEYFVNVHLSPTQMGTIVSCGQLVD